MDKSREDRILAFENIARRYHRDEDYRQKLEADPAGVLAEEGLEVPQDIEVRVVADKPGVRYFLIPEVPPSVSESELDRVSGGIPEDLYSGYGGPGDIFYDEYQVWRRENGY